MKKVLRGLAGSAAAVAITVGTSAVAMAAGVDSQALAPTDGVDAAVTESAPDVNIGNDLCLLPWYWQGPLNAGVEDMSGHYEACNGDTDWSEAEGVNILNGFCPTPWHWQGPINLLTDGVASHYEACN